MGAKLSKELENMLVNFISSELQSKAFDGVTYAMMIDSIQQDKVKIERYNTLLKQVSEEGYLEGELFRCHHIANGYIYDLDMSIVKHIMRKLAKLAGDSSSKEIESEALKMIKERPSQRRKNDMEKLATKCIEVAKESEEFRSKGSTEFEVALFNRNNTPKIIVSGRDKSTGMPLVATYEAYAVRHWNDLEDINNYILCERNLKIARVTAHEILPSRNGVRFTLKIQSMEKEGW